MTARALLQGHVRAGSWFAIAVDLENRGPAIAGELRLDAATPIGARFGTRVELATGSRKTYLLYALPPSFGATVTVTLVDGDRRLWPGEGGDRAARQPQLSSGSSPRTRQSWSCPSSTCSRVQGGLAVVTPLGAADLPERVEAWAPLDRLVWQDVDASALTPAQVAALTGLDRRWRPARIVGGGRRAPTSCRPARRHSCPTGRPPSWTWIRRLRPCWAVSRTRPGRCPRGRRARPGPRAGDVRRPRVAADGAVRQRVRDHARLRPDHLLARRRRRLGRAAVAPAAAAPSERRPSPLADDSQIVGAVANLPASRCRRWRPARPAVRVHRARGAGELPRAAPARPPRVGVGHRAGIDRRVHGRLVRLRRPAARDRTSSSTRWRSCAAQRERARRCAQSYLRHLLPVRATYQLRVPGEALLAAPINGDMFGDRTGEPGHARRGPVPGPDLEVGFGSMRAVRAESPGHRAGGEADLRLEGGRVTGADQQQLRRTLESPAIVLGGSATRLPDIAPGATARGRACAHHEPLNQANLSDRVVGHIFSTGDGIDEATQQRFVRRSVIDQLSLDPMTGFSGSLPGDTVSCCAGDGSGRAGRDGGTPRAPDDDRPVRDPLPIMIRGAVTFATT